MSAYIEFHVNAYSQALQSVDEDSGVYLLTSEDNIIPIVSENIGNATINFPDILDVNVIETITQTAFRELINNEWSKKIPYILAIVEEKMTNDEGGHSSKSNYFQFDAVSLQTWLSDNETNPLTNILVDKVYYFALNVFENNSTFEFLGHSSNFGKIKLTIESLLNNEDSITTKRRNYAIFIERQFPEEAFEHYKLAAEEDENGFDFCNLGIQYVEGFSTEENPELAYLNFEKSAKKLHSRGQNFLGESFEKGYGVRKNRTKALYYYELAAKQGEDEAKQNLERLQAEFKPKKHIRDEEHAQQNLEDAPVPKLRRVVIKKD